MGTYKVLNFIGVTTRSHQTKNRPERTIFFQDGLVGLLGFEPRQTESKSVVLPLHHNPITSPHYYLGVQK